MKPPLVDVGHRRQDAGSSSSDEGYNDVSGVPVEVLASAVVDRGRARVGVSGRELHVTQQHAGIEGGHDERAEACADERVRDRHVCRSL